MVLELEWQQLAEEKYLRVAVVEEEKFYLPNKKIHLNVVFFLRKYEKRISY